jgi:ribonuclease P protein component
MRGGVGPVRSTRVFDALRRTSYRGRSGPVSVSFAPQTSWSRSEVAYAIGRRVGNAVVRNRVRRRLRAIMADQADRRPIGAYLVRVGPEGPQLSFDELKVAMCQAVERATTPRSEGRTPARASAGSRG